MRIALPNRAARSPDERVSRCRWHLLIREASDLETRQAAGVAGRAVPGLPAITDLLKVKRSPCRSCQLNET